MSVWKRILPLLLVLALALAACGGGPAGNDAPSDAPTGAPEGTDNAPLPLNVIDDSYRTYYELFVYSFYDSDGDGIGDLPGVLSQLDYLNDGRGGGLGVNGLWLMPITPSPTYHKYDVTDYTAVDPQYGTLEDLRALLDACHDRGIRVILDLPMNHTSSAHPWFQAAADYLRSLPDGAEPDSAECPYLDYYHFSSAPKAGYVPLSGTGWLYEAQFWSGMPDLDLTNAAVRAELEAVASFWLELGVDGFRLDAVKEFITGDVEGNVAILRWFNDYVKSVDPRAFLVCECWTDQNTYARYYESGVDALFDFAFADNSGVIANVVKGTQPASAYGRALQSAQELYASYNPDYVGAPFYTNHDLGRSAGYYAGEDSEAQTKLGNAMNLLMSGSAFLYYGEDLGMKGSGADENKRAPMYWSDDPAAPGLCAGPPGMGSVKMKFGSLADQIDDPSSVYSYVKDAILLRNQFPAIARGQVAFLEDRSSESLCAITKSYGDQELLLLFNTSGQALSADLTGLTVQGQDARDLPLLRVLLTGEEPVERTETGLTLPARSVAVLGLPEA